jgi:8-oxo-dGTP pyrophosphatase MutT (NUDIX family)
MITKAGLLLFRDGQDAKELMFVRPHNKPFYVFPGGKQEENETIEQALAREIQEELAANIDNIDKLGTVTGQTPDGRDLEMHLFTANLLEEPKASSEIAEIHWLTRKSVLESKNLMTPMTLDHAMPFLDEKGVW